MRAGAIQSWWNDWLSSYLWFIGKGTPSPAAPTQKLVIIGPYKLCRNPVYYCDYNSFSFSEDKDGLELALPNFVYLQITPCQ